MADIPAGKVPIMESVKVAFSYLGEHWQKWLPACAILALASGWYQMQTVRTAVDAANGVNSGVIAFGVFCIFLLTSIIVSVGIYRHVIRGEFTPPIGIGFGIDEIRVLGVTLSLLLVFFIGFGFLFILFVLAASILVASSGLDPELAQTNPELFLQQFSEALGTGNGPFLIVLGLILVAAMMFVGVRLAFVTAATVSEERMMVFQTWSFAKGNFWRIIGAILLTVLPLAIIGGIIIAVSDIVILGSAESDARVNASLQQLFIVSTIEGFVNAIISIASIALMAYLYKGLRPSDEELEKMREKANES